VVQKGFLKVVIVWFIKNNENGRKQSNTNYSEGVKVIRHALASHQAEQSQDHTQSCWGMGQG
jgi:hypothetical protein